MTIPFFRLSEPQDNLAQLFAGQIGQGLDIAMERGVQQQEADILQNILQNAASQQDILQGILTSKIRPERQQQVISSLITPDQNLGNRQLTPQEIESITGNPELAVQIAGLPPSIQREIIKEERQKQQQRQLSEKISGLDILTEKEKELFPLLSPGSQLELFKKAQERAERRQEFLPETAKIEDVNEKNLDKVVKDISKSEFSGLTPKEVREQQKELRSLAKPVLEQANKDKKNIRQTLQDVKQLETLNKSEELNNILFNNPISDILLFDENGNLRFKKIPGVNTAPLELYSKILNRFIRGAKDFFGARVTNFDLQAFMNTLPTLLNSQKGRELVLKQMQLTTEIEDIYNKTLREVVRKAGGAKNIDINVAMEIADKVASERAKNKIDELNSFVEQSVNVEGQDNLEKEKRIGILNEEESKRIRSIFNIK